MIRCTAEERALGRVAVYRLLAMAFSYPDRDVRAALAEALPVGEVGASLLDDATAKAVAALTDAVRADPDLEADYQHVFTLSYSEDCPPYETAFSAKHIFQQAAQQADIAGFMRAFGVDPHGERPDHLATQLEFCYLLALKESRARELVEPDHVKICRDAQRNFQRQHLARWAPLIGQRIVITGGDSAYAAAGRLLIAFSSFEERFLRLGQVARYRDEPMLIADEPGDTECPMADVATAEVEDLQFYEQEQDGRYVAATAP